MGFQSTRPRGARQRYFQYQSRSDTCFNPRARVGRDMPDEGLVPIGGCFNPRARVGRDYAIEYEVSLRDCFNPRARVGRDSARWLAPEF